MTGAAVLTAVKRAAEVLFVEPPSGLTEAVTAAEELVASAEALSADPSTLHALALDCLAQRGDVSTNKLVGVALTRFTLATTGIGQAARQRAERDTTAALLKFNEELLTGWSEALAPRLAELTEAARVLPESIADYEQIVARGTGALEHWEKATTAIRMASAATSAVSALAALARIPVTRDRLALIYSEPDIAALDQIRSTGEQPTVWLAARAGMRLGLVASLPELSRRLDGYDAQRVQAARDYEAGRQPKKRPSLLS